MRQGHHPLHCGTETKQPLWFYLYLPHFYHNVIYMVSSSHNVAKKQPINPCVSPLQMSTSTNSTAFLKCSCSSSYFSLLHPRKMFEGEKLVNRITVFSIKSRFHPLSAVPPRYQLAWGTNDCCEMLPPNLPCNENGSEQSNTTTSALIAADSKKKIVQLRWRCRITKLSGFTKPLRR